MFVIAESRLKNLGEILYSRQLGSAWFKRKFEKISLLIDQLK